MSYHQPVLLQESIEALQITPEGYYVDATFGGGGHTRNILNKLGEKGRLFGFDQDADAAANVPNDERFTFIAQNFRYLKRFLKLYQVAKVDGILADLGVSSHQLDEATRGFSFRFDSELDMRMNQQSEKSAKDIINGYTLEELISIFSKYGEIRNARTLAQTIVTARQLRPVHQTTDLVAIIQPVIRGKAHKYLAQVFQALRIEVNNEMDVLEAFLMDAHDILKPGGRLVIIAYHSLEDRMVKRFLKTGNINGEVEKDFYGNIFRPFKLLTKKAMIPTDAEQQQNTRSRSAKMRVAEKL